jgi:hypothetical protein
MGLTVFMLKRRFPIFSPEIHAIEMVRMVSECCATPGETLYLIIPVMITIDMVC